MVVVLTGTHHVHLRTGWRQIWTKTESNICGGEESLQHHHSVGTLCMTRTFKWDSFSPVCARRTSIMFFPCGHLCNALPHINSTGAVPHQQGARLLQHTCTETAAPGADGFCFQRVGGVCETPAVSMIELCWLPANFQTKSHTFGLPCLVLNICSYFSLFPSLLPHTLTTPTPALSCNQSVVPTWKPLPVNWMEMLVWCDPIQSLNFCDFLDALATKFSNCDYSKHTARLVSLTALKTGNVPSSLCCHWVSVIERWAVLSIPLFTVLCINYRKGIQNIA